MKKFLSCPVETKLDDDAQMQVAIIAVMTPQHLLVVNGTQQYM